MTVSVVRSNGQEVPKNKIETGQKFILQTDLLLFKYLLFASSLSFIFCGYWFMFFFSQFLLYSIHRSGRKSFSRKFLARLYGRQINYKFRRDDDDEESENVITIFAFRKQHKKLLFFAPWKLLFADGVKTIRQRRRRLRGARSNCYLRIFHQLFALP